MRYLSINVFDMMENVSLENIFSQKMYVFHQNWENDSPHKWMKNIYLNKFLIWFNHMSQSKRRKNVQYLIVLSMIKPILHLVQLSCVTYFYIQLNTERHFPLSGGSCSPQLKVIQNVFHQYFCHTKHPLQTKNQL